MPSLSLTVSHTEPGWEPNDSALRLLATIDHVLFIIFHAFVEVVFTGPCRRQNNYAPNEESPILDNRCDTRFIGTTQRRYALRVE